ncbi:MAG: nuclear transport factor 2 family protein [Alphaproteobacteria bacterium]|nr:nuclear transport factor 2 family protein [Alphaproteobacteria bacterium]
MRHLITSLFLVLALATHATAKDTDRAAVDAVLDNFHKAASEANWGTYFGLMSDDAIFLGTDAGERWDIPTFKSYALPTKGWTYTVRERHINFTPDGNTAWFDELLDNKSYGTSRGTGVLIRTNSGWKISQYHLTFPIPNDLAAGFTKQIQAFEKRQKAGQK